MTAPRLRVRHKHWHIVETFADGSMLHFGMAFKEKRPALKVVAARAAQYRRLGMKLKGTQTHGYRLAPAVGPGRVLRVQGCWCNALKPDRKLLFLGSKARPLGYRYSEHGL